MDDMEITLTIRPGNLSPEQFGKIAERATEEGITKDQFVVDAILAKLAMKSARRIRANRKELAAK